MDLRQYFKKLRETEQQIAEPFPLIVSLDTSAGGKAGALSEVSREVAAKAIVDGHAVLAGDAQKEAYWAAERAKLEAVESAEVARRLQVAVISEHEFERMKRRPAKTPHSESSR